MDVGRRIDEYMMVGRRTIFLGGDIGCANGEVWMGGNGKRWIDVICMVLGKRLMESIGEIGGMLGLH